MTTAVFASTRCEAMRSWTYRAPRDPASISDAGPDVQHTPRAGLSPGRLAYRDKANRRPSSTDASNAGGTFPTRCVRNVLSMVMIWDTLTTDGFDKPVPLTASRTFPGASASRRFDVMTAPITVLIRLSLKLLAEMIRYGLRYPGPEPDGSGKEAHQTSPRRATIYRA